MNSLTRKSKLLLALVCQLSIINCHLSFATERVGAQVWLERGMNKAQIDGYFQKLDQQHMHVARLFMMWNFMETAPNQWDFQIFDWAFESAAKYKVGIVATLMPNFGPTHRGFYYKTQDGVIAKSRRQLDESRMYMQTVVKRYASHPALSNWMLYNEPGQMPAADSLAMDRFQSFLELKYKNIKQLNTAWLTGFSDFKQITYSPNWAGGGFTWPVSYLDWQNFWAEHLTWYLQEVASEIRKIDTKTPLHVNPHALLEIPHRYQLSEWTKFLTSLGASIHPVWHFNDLNRQDYPFGVSLVCNMVGAAAGDKPFWVTELQGGHNLYTGSQPVNPTTKEISAWLWTSIISGAEKTIFWCLNPRSQGGEAGEWALLDNKNEPSHRLIEAGKIAAEVEANKDFFEKASVVKDNIIIAISPETMFLQERNGKGQNQIARQQKAHFLSVLGCYKALKMKGYNPVLEFIDHIDWTSKSAKTRMVIVPHATSLTDLQLSAMKDFCNLGNTLLLSGLPGMFNENEKYRWSENSTFEALTGTKVLEIFTPENEGSFFLPYETFRAKTEPISARQNPKGYFENQLGKGKCIFVPAVTDLKFWLESEEKLYPAFLDEMAKSFKNPFQGDLKSEVPGSYLQSLSNGSKIITLVHVPASEEVAKVQFERKGEKLLKIMSGKGQRLTSGSLSFEIESGETFVVMSEKAILPAKP